MKGKGFCAEMMMVMVATLRLMKAVMVLYDLLPVALLRCHTWLRTIPWNVSFGPPPKILEDNCDRPSPAFRGGKK